MSVLADFADIHCVEQDAAEHCIPLAPCPLCNSNDLRIILFEELQCHMLECDTCGLTFGLPNGYSSRLDLANDWNHRNQIRVGWWVLFDWTIEGDNSNGFFIDDARKEHFDEEDGWLPHKFIPMYRTITEND